MQSGEQISSTIRIQGKEVNGEDVTWKEGCVVFATKNGIVKKSSLIDFENIRKGGIIAIQIEEGDELIEADFAKLGDEVVLVTKSGMSIRFNEDEMRAQGRNTVGVYGIKLDDKDSVVGMALVDNKATLLVVGENGVGKRTSFEEYRVQSRGGKGVITMKTGE